MALRFLVLVLVVVCGCIATTSFGQESNMMVTMTGPQESNTVTRIERIDTSTHQTNLLTKKKFFRGGRLIEDLTERKGPVDLVAIRVYHEGQLIMLQAWDSKSKITQRTFLRDGRAVVTEISSKSGSPPDLILFHGKDEEIVSAMKRDDVGELKMLDATALKEIQRGAKVGTEFMNGLSTEKW